jgi:crotonobetainyl-CoA:carnitine CoA-transferase CaiB-like acyl-CoA transferase
MSSPLPLTGIKVLDFSTLLPGPVCSLLLSEAGAEVIKVERPQDGDEMRSYHPKAGEDSGNFVILNRGKQSIAIDLKNPEIIAQLTPIITECDILIEQFRPGVMVRLGLGYETLKVINPRLIYCSITGFGQTGPDAMLAAHDLNYAAQTGMLSLVADTNGYPSLPPALIADIAGGAYPAFSNILLALRQRDITGEGSFLDISMSDNLFTFMYWVIAEQQLNGKSPKVASSLVTGGTPRYHIYKTKDERFLAAAPIEDKFWNNFCKLIHLEERYRDISCSPKEVSEAVATIIQSKTAREWEVIFEGHDVCSVIIKTFDEALQSKHFASRGIFNKLINHNDGQIMALPIPIVNSLRRQEESLDYPKLGEHTKTILG